MTERTATQADAAEDGRMRRTVILGAVFVIAFAVRWVTLSSVQGDDHWSLWTAATFLKGDLPFRDFVDLGDPLYWGMSALAQAIAGYRLLGEVVLGMVLIAFAFAVAFHLAWRASGSLPVAIGLTALGLLLVTERELYSYPKLFVYPLALWFCWRYIDRPTLLRSAALAFGVAVAFGYRHDHGAYAGVGAAAAILAAHWPDGPRRIVLAWLRFGVALLLLLSPYLALIQANEGIVQYFQERMRLARQMDEDSRYSVWFRVDSAAPAHWMRIEPPHPARVFAEWQPDVTSETRMALERTYSLTNALDPKEGLYDYFLTDLSPDTLAALVSDPGIVGSSGVTTPPDAPPAAQTRVQIRWDSSIDEAQRAALERQYGLLNDRNNRWEYALTDVSRENIRALVEDPSAYDTGLIHRDTYRPMEESWVIAVQRAIPLFRISIAPRYWHWENAGVFLHYLSLALPYIMLIMLAADWLRGRRSGRMVNAPEKMFAAAVMAAVVYHALLRQVGYFADHGALATILGACVLGHAFGAARWPRPAAARVVTGVLAGAVLVISAFAAIAYARSTTSLEALNNHWVNVRATNVRKFQAYTSSPPIDGYAPPGTTGDTALIRYIYDCTRPDDRVWVLSDLFTFPYHTERRVVGHIYWKAGLLASPAYQRKTIETVEKDEVPIIIGLGDAPGPLDYLKPYPLVHQYVAQRYTSHYAIPADRGSSTFWLLMDSRRTPTGTYELFAGPRGTGEPFVLPCFR